MRYLFMTLALIIVSAGNVSAADWSKPTLTDTYTNFRAYLSDRLNDSALQFDSASTSPTNLPAGTKRWNAGTNTWEKWSGSAWSSLATSNLYGINISGNAATATNSTQLNGQAASYYQQASTAITTSNIASQTVATANAIAASAIAQVYPVGSVYISTVSTSPATLFGMGTWVRIGEGRCLIDAGATYTAGSTGGAATKTLTTTELPAHTHTGTTASNGPHTHTVPAPTGAGGGDSGAEYRGDLSGSPTQNTSSSGAHTHTFTSDSRGSGAAFDIMNPYVAVYIWKRTS